MLFRFFENKEGMNYAPVFNPLLGSLDEAARGLLVRRLQPAMPAKAPDQKTWLDPYLREVDRRMQNHYQNMAQNLKRTLVFNNGIMPLGLLRSCMEYALNSRLPRSWLASQAEPLSPG
jgi:type III restriction enzyme